MSFVSNGADPTAPIGVAVSGGGDSIALLHLMVHWAENAGIRLFVATVDHGLRKESAQDAGFVAAACDRLGVSHSVLNWRGWDGSGNLQDQARRARYGLIADWASANGIATIALGHTADDQAETFLMRLARQAGVDGLAGMSGSRHAFGKTWKRPLLLIGRQELRDYLNRNEIAWIDDPSNEDERFDRVKARKVLAGLAPLGIDADVLSGVAAHLASVRQALDYQTSLAAREFAHIEAGDVCIDQRGFISQPPEISRRLLVHAIKWVASAEYGPRGRAIAEVRATVLSGGDATLAGCRIITEKSGFRITREAQAVKNTRSAVGQPWDRRWQVSGPEIKGFEVAILGAKGLKLCQEWRYSGLPRVSLLASPAVWKNGELIAAPLAGLGDGWSVQLIKGEKHFFKSILSH